MSRISRSVKKAARKVAKAVGRKTGAPEAKARAAESQPGESAPEGGRPIYMRPYHLTYVVGFYARRANGNGLGALGKWGPVVKRIENEPNPTVRIVECYDDACVNCRNLRTDAGGSIWGVGQSCLGSRDPQILAEILEADRDVVNALNLSCGSTIAMKDLVEVLAEKIPNHRSIVEKVDLQADYERGLRELREKYEGL